MLNPFASIEIPALERVISVHVPDFSELSDEEARTLGMCLIEWANR